MYKLNSDLNTNLDELESWVDLYNNTRIQSDTSFDSVVLISPSDRTHNANKPTRVYQMSSGSAITGMPKEYPQGTTFVGNRYIHWWDANNMSMELLNILTGERYFRHYNNNTGQWDNWIYENSSLVVYNSADQSKGTVVESNSSITINSIAGYKYLDIRLCFVASADIYAYADVTLSIDILKLGNTQVSAVARNTSDQKAYFHCQNIYLTTDATKLWFGNGFRITLMASATSPVSFYDSGQCRVIRVIAKS